MLRRHLERFFADSNGATAIEYALVALVIGLGIIIGSQSLRDSINALYGRIVNNMTY